MTILTFMQVKSIKEGVIYDGKFRSPLAAYLPGMLPRESEEARYLREINLTR